MSQLLQMIALLLVSAQAFAGPLNKFPPELDEPDPCDVENPHHCRLSWSLIGPLILVGILALAVGIGMGYIACDGCRCCREDSVDAEYLQIRHPVDHYFTLQGRAQTYGTT